MKNMNVKKVFLSAALALAVASAAAAAPLDAFKGMSGTMDIAGGTAHIPVMKEAAKRIGYPVVLRPAFTLGGAGGGAAEGGQGDQPVQHPLQAGMFAQLVSQFHGYSSFTFTTGRSRTRRRAETN